MKLFQVVQKHMALSGFVANQRRFNKKHLLGCFLFVLNISLACVNFYFAADSIEVYMSSIFLTLIGVPLFLAYTTTIFQAQKLFDLIKWTEMACDSSKSTAFEYIHSFGNGIPLNK